MEFIIIQSHSHVTTLFDGRSHSMIVSVTSARVPIKKYSMPAETLKPTKHKMARKTATAEMIVSVSMLWQQYTSVRLPHELDFIFYIYNEAGFPQHWTCFSYKGLWHQCIQYCLSIFYQNRTWHWIHFVWSYIQCYLNQIFHISHAIQSWGKKMHWHFICGTIIIKTKWHKWNNVIKFVHWLFA